MEWRVLAQAGDRVALPRRAAAEREPAPSPAVRLVAGVLVVAVTACGVVLARAAGGLWRRAIAEVRARDAPRRAIGRRGGRVTPAASGRDAGPAPADTVSVGLPVNPLDSANRRGFRGRTRSDKHRRGCKFLVA